MKERFMGFDKATILRFWSKVDKKDTNSCWLWRGSVSDRGYGKFYVKGEQYAHRFSLKLLSLPSKGDHAMHLCNNPLCCNPSHLRWGTQKQNMIYARDCERIPTAKLNKRSAAEIKNLLELGATQTQLAKQYNVSSRAIRLIKTSQTWAI